MQFKTQAVWKVVVLQFLKCILLFACFSVVSFQLFTGLPTLTLFLVVLFLFHFFFSFFSLLKGNSVKYAQFACFFPPENIDVLHTKLCFFLSGYLVQEDMLMKHNVWTFFCLRLQIHIKKVLSTFFIKMEINLLVHWSTPACVSKFSHS